MSLKLDEEKGKTMIGGSYYVWLVVLGRLVKLALDWRALKE